jgi:hypothetical protein
MRRHHFHPCSQCGHSNKIRCTAPPIDDDGPSWGACEAEAEADRKGERFLCEDCQADQDDVIATIRRGRTT